MTEPQVTTDTILEWLKEQVESKQPISPHTFLDAAMKLNLLLQDESSKLYVAEQECAKMRAELVEGGKTSASAKIVVEASNEYRFAREQKAKIERIIEMVRLSKIQARIANEEYRNS